MLLNSILVPLDGSPLSERALSYATGLARAGGASLTLVRTTDARPRLRLGLTRLLPGDPSRYLNTHAYRLRTQGLTVDTTVAPGEPTHALIAEIERRQPDLVVMSTHGRSGINCLVHGSVTDAIVSRSKRPVMLVRACTSSEASAGQQLTGKPVVVPLDGSRFAETALPIAVDVARTLGSELVLVQAIIPLYPLAIDLKTLACSELDEAMGLADAEDAATNYLSGLACRLSASEHGLREITLARIGPLTNVIRELSTDAAVRLHSPLGLVVMATHGRTGLSRAILGGEADAVVRDDHVPVVLVRPHGAESVPQVEVEKTLAAAGGAGLRYA